MHTWSRHDVGMIYVLLSICAPWHSFAVTVLIAVGCALPKYILLKCLHWTKRGYVFQINEIVSANGVNMHLANGTVFARHFLVRCANYKLGEDIDIVYCPYMWRRPA